MKQGHQKSLFYRITALLCLTFLLTISCAPSTNYDVDESLEQISIKELLSSPQELTMDGLELDVEAYLWRDFAPISPPDGKPLIASITIESKDSEPLPENLDTDAVWVIYDNDVWGSGYSDELFKDDRFQIRKTARDGPKFDPDVKVTVVIRILHGDSTYMLRKIGQEIVKTM